MKDNSNPRSREELSIPVIRFEPQPPVLTQEEMRQILGYVWAKQYFRGDGNAVRAKIIFERKTCAS